MHTREKVTPGIFLALWGHVVYMIRFYSRVGQTDAAVKGTKTATLCRSYFMRVCVYDLV